MEETNRNRSPPAQLDYGPEKREMHLIPCLPAHSERACTAGLVARDIAGGLMRISATVLARVVSLVTGIRVALAT